jgi:hypothetical protein
LEAICSSDGLPPPSSAATLSSSIGTGFYDVNAYYASWFITGKAPTIDHDVLYYFHRREPVSAAAPAQQAMTVVGRTPGQDNIELLAFSPRRERSRSRRAGRRRR